MPQYPRQVMKRIMRQSDPQMRVSGNADVLVRAGGPGLDSKPPRPSPKAHASPGRVQAYVDYVSFIRELAAEASSAAEAAGSREIDVHHVEAALEVRRAAWRTLGRRRRWRSSTPRFTPPTLP